MKDDITTALDSLKRRGSRAGLDSLVRFGIETDRAFGVPMREIQTLGRQFGKHHDLADELWKSGWYDARLLAAYVDEAAAVTPAQMDRWCRDFDNWGLCDTVCFVLFDKTPHAWAMVKKWADRRQEFQKRAAFALLWGLTVHDKAAPDRPFVEGLSLIERASTDDRHFVKKGVNMALRAVGKRNAALHARAVKVAARLAASTSESARWIGKDAARELATPSVARRLTQRT